MLMMSQVWMLMTEFSTKRKICSVFLEVLLEVSMVNPRVIVLYDVHARVVW